MITVKKKETLTLLTQSSVRDWANRTQGNDERVRGGFPTRKYT